MQVATDLLTQRLFKFNVQHVGFVPFVMRCEENGSRQTPCPYYASVLGLLFINSKQKPKAHVQALIILCCIVSRRHSSLCLRGLCWN